MGKSYELVTEAATLSMTLAETAIHAGNIDEARDAARKTELSSRHLWYTRDRERAQDLARRARGRADFLKNLDARKSLENAMKEMQAVK